MKPLHIAALILLVLILYFLVIPAISVLWMAQTTVSEVNYASSSTHYWSKEARPFGINTPQAMLRGTIFLNVVNLGDENLTLNSIIVGSAIYSGAVPLAPGELKTLTLTGGAVGHSHEEYSFPVEINYTNSNGATMTQHGSSNLLGNYGSV